MRASSRADGPPYTGPHLVTLRTLPGLGGPGVFTLHAIRFTEKREEKLQTSVARLCYCFLVEYLALAGLMNFLAQLSDKIHHFTVYNLMPLAFLTKLSKMH